MNKKAVFKDGNEIPGTVQDAGQDGMIPAVQLMALWENQRDSGECKIDWNKTLDQMLNEEDATTCLAYGSDIQAQTDQLAKKTAMLKAVIDNSARERKAITATSIKQLDESVGTDQKSGAMSSGSTQ